MEDLNEINNQKFLGLIMAIDNNLADKAMSSRESAVFQETILKLATGKIGCTGSIFLPVDDNKVGLSFIGLPAEDALKLDDMLKMHHIDVTLKQNALTDIKDIQEQLDVCKAKISDEQYKKMVNELTNICGCEFVLEMSNEDAESKLLPLFFDEIEKIYANSPESLEDYQKASEKDMLVQVVKSAKLGDPVVEGAHKLEDECQDQYTKGALHLITSGIEKLRGDEKNSIREKSISMLFGLESEYEGVGKYAPAVKFAYKQFSQLQKETPALQTEAATQFKRDFKEYSNFEERVKAIQDNSASLSKLSSLFGSALANKGRDRSNDLEELLQSELSSGLKLG